MDAIPDLLNARPSEPADLNERKKALAFAFATGDSAGALGEILDRAIVSNSTFEPPCFASDLYVDAFIDECLTISRDDFAPPVSKGFLKTVLCRVPSDMDTVRFRQDVLRELLGQPQLRGELEETYRKLVELREDLDSSGEFGRVYFSRWRIDVLVRVKHTIDFLKDRFIGAVSGLARIGDYGLELSRTDGYGNLKALLDYEDEMATVGMQLRLGSDGRVRGFEIVSLGENGGNRFHAGPWRRWLSRLSAQIRGYRITGEELIERWVDRVFEMMVADLVPMLQLIGDIEFYLAALHFRDDATKRGLETCLADFSGGPGAGRLTTGLFNPLLLSGEEPPVTCDISTEPADKMVIVTGPNSGGKTRLLQALAFEQLLGQTGFFTNAKSAVLAPASGMFVSMVDAGSADQKEGRLGMELLRIRRLFEHAKEGALIVLDELCSGTNPSEGEEIFLLVASLLGELVPEAFVSTHFLRFTAKLAEKQPFPYLKFLQVELDGEARPTYRFVDGVAATSLAEQTARRLGVTRDELLRLIEKNRGSLVQA